MTRLGREKTKQKIHCSLKIDFYYFGYESYVLRPFNKADWQMTLQNTIYFFLLKREACVKLATLI